MISKNSIYQLKKYCKYLLCARHKGGHDIHSPYIFNFVTNLLEIKEQYYAYREIENLIEELKASNELIECQGFGAGSNVNPKISRSVANITKKSSIKVKYGRLLFRLINYFQPHTVIETGTSLGISTCYMAKANPKSMIYSIEACKNKIEKAKINFDKLKINNVDFINDNFDNALPKILLKINQLDFAFFDGNHQKEPTLKYFNLCIEKIQNDTVFVFDDIYWSPQMTEAWEVIKNHKQVTVTIDLFYMGIVFFRKELQKQHYVIRF